MGGPLEQEAMTASPEPTDDDDDSKVADVASQPDQPGVAVGDTFEELDKDVATHDEVLEENGPTSDELEAEREDGDDDHDGDEEE